MSDPAVGVSDDDDAWARRCWQLFALAAATFLLLLFRVQATGEEAVYTVEAYEQWIAHDWLRPTFLGSAYQRPPLFTDLIALLAGVLGWTGWLAAARLVSSLGTVASGLTVAAFSRRLGHSRGRCAFSALVYLSLAEPLFYYGWLGYSDALFGALVLAAMLCTWVALRERRAGWLAVALLFAFAGFLTKALTAYVFAGAAGLLCLWHYRAWNCLRRVSFWLALLPLALPVLWYASAPSGGTMAHGMLSDITGKLGQHGSAAWLRHLVALSGNALLNLMPAAGVVLCALWGRWRRGAAAVPGSEAADPGGAAATAGLAPPGGSPAGPPRRGGEAGLAALIALLNFLPYGLAPQGGPRYLMPLYGLMALAFTGVLWSTPGHRRWMLRLAVAAIALKVLAAAWLFPAYTTRARPDLAAIAAEVQAHEQGLVPEQPPAPVTGPSRGAVGAPGASASPAPLRYANTDAWVGLSVVALVDTAPPGRRTPLVRPPPDWTDALLLSDHAEDAVAPSRLMKDFGGVQLYCRGSACR